MSDPSPPRLGPSLAPSARGPGPIQLIAQALDSGNLASKIAASLEGTGISPGRFKRAALAALSRPEAANLVEKCDRNSICSEIMSAAACGLELHPALGQAYLVPRGGRAALQISYKGRITLALRHPKICAIDYGVIREGDEYDFEEGTTPFLRLRRNLAGGARGWIAAYCVTHWSGGLSIPELMTKSQIEEHRDRFSEGWRRGGKAAAIWRDHPKEMAKKTVVLRASKAWPIAIPGAAHMDESHMIYDHRDVDYARR